jgi:hypothetical protein
MRMRDTDIRNLLRKTVLSRIFDSIPQTRIIEEMEVCRGDARIDVAVINGTLSGFEIKSSYDDLRRLPHQIEIYSKVFDAITLVVTSNHVAAIQGVLPEWWGIDVVKEVDNGEVQIDVIRQERLNDSTDAQSIAKLLWRDEALSLLTELKIDRGYRSKRRELICQRLADSLQLADLKDKVREKLKNRADWRVDLPQTSNDGLFPLFSM